jgi:hypothetical protein
MATILGSVIGGFLTHCDSIEIDAAIRFIWENRENLIDAGRFFQHFNAEAPTKVMGRRRSVIPGYGAGKRLRAFPVDRDGIEVTCNLCAERVPPEGIARLIHLAERHPLALLALPPVQRLIFDLSGLSRVLGEKCGDFMSGSKAKESDG